MKVIGLTGGIASGKSTVSMLFRGKGAVIIDADQVARELLCPGTKTCSEVVKYFGEDILEDDKSIDRKKLGKIVFADGRKLEALNRITHPEIIGEIICRLERYRKEGRYDVAVIDAALLLEAGLDSVADEVWLVAIDEKTQIQRLLEREKGLTIEGAMERIGAQSTQEEKAMRADRIIDNSGTLKQTEERFESIWRDFCLS